MVKYISCSGFGYSSGRRITPFTIEIHGTEGSILYTEPGIGAFVLARQEQAEGGAGVEHPTEREVCQGSLAVYDRRYTRETEKILSDSFNVTKH